VSEILPRVWIQSLKFSDGSVITLRRDDILVLVGPNNSGKSAALRAIRDKISQTSIHSPVVLSVERQLVGKAEDVIAWLNRTARRPDSPLQPTFRILDFSL